MTQAKKNPGHCANSAGATQEKFGQLQSQFSLPRGRCQVRCLEILFSHPEGILSHDLRYATKTQNIAHVRRQLNGKGFFNECEMERVIDDDGYEYQIGRCSLTKEGCENARAFFREC